MSLSFSVLASGSMGNTTLLVLDEPGGPRHVLVDCGISPRATAERLATLGVDVDRVSDIVLTHLDGDHFHPGWRKHVQKHDVIVHAHQRHRSRLRIDGRFIELFQGPFRLGATTEVEPTMLAHDALGTVGFVFENDGARLGFATDLGHVPATLTDTFVDLHALAIESNYDPSLQRLSPRPLFLKQRIMNGRGHLSNEQSLEAVLAVETRSRLAHIVTLHLSRDCNEPAIVRRGYERRAPHLIERLTIATQNEPTSLLGVAVDGAPTPGSPIDCLARQRPDPTRGRPG